MKTEKPSKVKKTSKPLAIFSGVLFVAVAVVGGYFFWYVMQKTSFTQQVYQRKGGISTAVVEQQKTEESSSQSSDQNTDKTNQNQNNTEANKTEITADTYAGVNQQFVEELYQPGEYINIYEMNLRDGPSVDNMDIGTLDPGAGLNVTDIVAENATVWGGDESGQWIALQDDALVYCYGPGLYQTSEVTPIYNSVNSTETVGNLEAGWRVYIKEVQNQDGVLWGILEDGKAIKLYENETNLINR